MYQEASGLTAAGMLDVLKSVAQSVEEIQSEMRRTKPQMKYNGSNIASRVCQELVKVVI